MYTFVILKLWSYWIKVYQIYTQGSRIIADELFKIRMAILQSVSECQVKGKGKGFPYSLPSVGPGADAGVQAVSPQVTISHPPGGRLPLLSARPAVIFPAAQHLLLFVGTKLYCLVTEA